MRTAEAAGSAATLDMDTIVPLRWKEKTAFADGAICPGAGLIRTLPVRTSTADLGIRTWMELRGAIAYGIGDDAMSTNVTEPEIAASDGLIRLTTVVQPPPSAKCAIDNAPVVVRARSTTGIVVIRNSDRSLVKPRSAMTP